MSIIIPPTRLNTFLQENLAKADFTVTTLPRDASFRQYYRISQGQGSFILMDSAAEQYNFKAFVQIAKFLYKNKFSTPKIYAVDYDSHLLLLEDFGRISIKQYLVDNATTEQKWPIYKLAIDLLLQLNTIKPAIEIPHFTNEMLLKELQTVCDWYISYITGKKLDPKAEKDFKVIWQDLLRKTDAFQPVIVLRDYHVENMMLLKRRKTIRSIGLLDFQDAALGSPLYDLVSLLEDVRYNGITPELRDQGLDYYSQNANPASQADILREYHIIGAQRNSRILGFFARKFLRDKQEHYLKYIPLLLKYLQHDLSHPELSDLKQWFKQQKIIA